MVSLAALYVLLARYSGQNDLCIGTPIANRNRTDIEPLVGFFVNTLAMRTEVTGGQTFRSLVKQVFKHTLDDYEHQELPFGKLVEALSPRRGAGRTPLFQLMFSFQNTPEAQWTIPGVQVTTHRVDTLTSKFDFTLSLEMRDGGLQGVAEYDASRFDQKTTTDLVGRYVALSRDLLNQPDAPVGSHFIVSQDEWTRLIHSFNDTARSFPDVCLHEAIEEQALRQPDAIALTIEGRHVSYGALNEQAQAWADRLVGMGVRADTLVGVCLHRHEHMLVSLLAVLKAGGAYLPIEPDLPRERVALMLRDSGARVVMCHEGTARPDTVVGVDWLCMDALSAAPPPEGQPPVRPRCSPGQLAYVLYTSGSTGLPKGATLNHRGVVNRLHWMWRRYGFTSVDVFVQKTPFSFDVSVWELFMPLMFGARLVIVRPDGHRDPDHLCEVFAETGVTVAHFVPSMLGPFLTAAQHRRVPRLKQIICSGEALGAQVAHAAIKQLGCQLHNLYGPTEASIDVSAWTCSLGDSVVPIGRPIDNTRLYILDGCMEPVPVGVAGELYIGGVGLARGYLRRARLTAERFVPDPFAGEEGGRLYRTGDLARYRRDGQIEYLGRLDHQVKVRGFRIELGEVESALLGCEGVREAVVVARGEGAQQQLVGYVGSAGAAVEPHVLRQVLLGRLPGYMVPSHLVVMQALPLSPNGKVDRKSLPEPGASAGVARVYEAPCTEQEERMAALWSQVLKVDRVGRHDDFFELGGHSLLATQVIARLRQDSGVSLPLRSLFESPTVAGLSLHLVQAESQSAQEEQVRIPVLKRPGPLPASYAQQRLWFIEQMMPEHAVYHVPLSVELRGEVNEAVLQEVLQGLMRRHESLRTGLRMQEGELVQEVDPSAIVPLQWLDGRDPGARRSLEALVAQPFDLTRAPLWRVAVVRHDWGVKLRMVFHHIIVDAWSIGVLMRDLARLYAQETQGVQADLPRLSVQHGDHAAWERDRLQRQEVLQGLLSYWQGQLQGLPPMLELPTDRPRKASASGRGGVCQVRVPVALKGVLERFCQARGLTLFMGLLGALQVLLSRYSGQTDLAVGAPIANRQHAQLNDVVGF
ncbi:MAG: amino acid adenylation domain-containing protein, partial [Polaromonas sp.]